MSMSRSLESIALHVPLNAREDPCNKGASIRQPKPVEAMRQWRRRVRDGGGEAGREMHRFDGVGGGELGAQSGREEQKKEN